MHDPLMSDQTTTTHASGPGAGAPLVAGRCPACHGMALFLGDGGHVTCSRLSCPNPVAADELLHPPQPLADWERELLDKEEADATHRREWAAAYRDAAARLAMLGMSRGADALRDIADRIESGQLTPWADQPEPAAARCGTCQLPIRRTGPDRWVHEADGSDDFDPPHHAQPASAPAQPSGAAPAENGGTWSGRDLAAVKALIAHQRRDIGSCICGWGVNEGNLGQSHALHVWRELQRAAPSLAALTGGDSR